MTPVQLWFGEPPVTWPADVLPREGHRPTFSERLQSTPATPAPTVLLTFFIENKMNRARAFHLELIISPLFPKYTAVHGSHAVSKQDKETLISLLGNKPG